MVQERNIESFLPDIKNAMLNNPSQNARTFALLLLVSKKINVEIDFLSSSGIVRINPSVIKPPFVDKKFNDVSRRMISEFKNPTISDNAIDIFSRYILDIYPLEVNEEDDIIVATLFILSSECLQMKDVPTLEEHCKNKEIDFNKKELNDFINNDKVIQFAKEKGYKFVFKPHRNLYEFIESFRKRNEYIPF